MLSAYPTVMKAKNFFIKLSSFFNTNNNNGVQGKKRTSPKEQAQSHRTPTRGCSPLINFRFYGRSVYRQADSDSVIDNLQKSTLLP